MFWRRINFFYAYSLCFGVGRDSVTGVDVRVATYPEAVVGGRIWSFWREPLSRGDVAVAAWGLHGLYACGRAQCIPSREGQGYASDSYSMTKRWVEEPEGVRRVTK